MLLSMTTSCHTANAEKSTTAKIRIYRPTMTDEVTVYVNGRKFGSSDAAVLDALKSVRESRVTSASIKLYAIDVFKLELSTGSAAPEPYMSLFFKSAPQVVAEYNELIKKVDCSEYTSTPIDLPKSQQESLDKLRIELDADIKGDLSGSNPTASILAL